MQLLKQSTAVTVNFGPFIDDTDFKTTETALSPATSISKAGGAFGAGPTGSHQSDGHYSLSLTSTHTDTLGSLRVESKVSGALSVWRDFLVVPANVYDALVAGSDKLETDVQQFGGTNGTFASGRPEVNTTHAAGTAWNSGAIGASTLATDTITAAKIATDAIGSAEFAQAAADKVWSSTTRTVSAATNITSTGGTVPITVGGLVSADMTAISTDTTAANSFEAMLDATPGDLTVSAIVLSSPIVANVTHWASGSVPNPATTGVPKVDVTHVSGDAGAADNVEAFFDGTGYNASTSAIGTVATATNVTTVNGLAADVITASALATSAVDEIWEYATANITTAGGIGKTLVDNVASILDDTGTSGVVVNTFTTAGKAEIQTEANDAIVANRLDELLAADSDIDGAAPPTVGSVFHELMSKTAGSFTFDQTTDSNEAIRDAVTVAGDPWATALPGAYGAGTAGKIVGDNINATITSRSSHSASDVWAVTTRRVSDATNITSTGGTVPISNNLVLVDVNAIANDTDGATNLLSEYDGTGWGELLQRTTISSLSTQTSFVLTNGSADNDAYNGARIVIQDATTAAQKAVGVILDYTGATKTVTLKDDPAVFTMAAGDTVTILADRSLKPTVDNRTLDVTSTGAAGIDWNNVENPTTTVGLSGTTIATATNVTTVNGIAADVITATSIAADAIGSSELAATAAQEIADAVLSRSVSNVEGSAGEHTLCTVILAMLEWSISGTTWTINRTDGTTTHATKTLTAAAGDPITSVT